MEWIKWTFAFIGHLGIGCVAYNLTNSTNLPRGVRKTGEIIILLLVTLPLGFLVATQFFWNRLGADLQQLLESARLSRYGLLANYYACFSVVAGAWFFSKWAFRKFTSKLPSAITESRRSTFDLRAEIGMPLLHGLTAKVLGLLPRNEVLTLTTEEMTWELDVPVELDGLRICQLSDLHFTGQIDVAWFHSIIEKANAFKPHLIVITGDLLDDPECLPWLEATLGKLKSELGCFYVLGNHDVRIKDTAAYRKLLREIGLTAVAGVWHSVHFRGIPIHLTGNELPWYRDARNLPAMHSTNGQPRSDFRILLSHSPDQIVWAREHDFDLMFAGHTHGGQIAFPLVGPIVAPSKYGVQYASGTFQIERMLMHVSRGISGDEPIRFGSPPELGLFTIRSKRVS